MEHCASLMSSRCPDGQVSLAPAAVKTQPQCWSSGSSGRVRCHVGATTVKPMWLSSFLSDLTIRHRCAHGQASETYRWYRPDVAGYTASGAAST